MQTINFDHIWWDVRRSIYSLKNRAILSILLLQAAAFILVQAKGAGSIYADMLICLIGVTAAGWTCTTYMHGNYIYLIYSILLFTVGNMLQCIFRAETLAKNPDYDIGAATASLQLQYIFAFLAAFGAAFIYRKYTRLSTMNSCCMLMAASLFISMVTLVFGHGSVRNWITIGNISIQTTEIVKYLYVLICASLLGSVEHPDRKRIRIFYVITAIHMAILVIQSEFGTLLLIGFIFLIYALLFIDDIRYVLFTTLICIAGMGIVAFLGMKLTKLSLEGSALATNPLSRLFLSNYTKIANRVIYWMHPEADALGNGYQLLKAKEAIVLGGWFGTSSVTDIPVRTSDLVYPALIERCGMVFAILVFALFVFMWLEGMRLMMRKQDRYHRAVAAGYVCMIFVQALIIIGGSTGLCPLTGITLPFISSGGTSLAVSFMMVGTLIAISGNVSWKGMIENEQEEFFEKSAGTAKHHVGLRHSHDTGIGANFRNLAGSFKKRRRTKTKSKTADV